VSTKIVGPLCLALLAISVVPGAAVNAASTGWTADASLSVAVGSLGAAAAPCFGHLSVQCLYAVGGLTQNANGVASVTMYNPAKKSWSAVAPLKTGRSEAGVASGPCPANPSRDCVFAIGGANASGTYLTSAESFDPKTGKWTDVASLPTPGAPPTFPGRAQLAATSGPCFGDTTQTCVYALGGYNPALYTLTSVQEYNPRTKAWSQAASLATARARFAVTSAPCAGQGSRTCLYAIGGTGPDGFLSSVEMYSPAANTWKSVAGLHERESASTLGLQGLGDATAPCSSAASKLCVYAYGGLDQKFAILGATMEFSPGADRWSFLSATMSTARDNFASASAECAGNSERCLYAIGGAGQTYTPSVEQFAP